MVKWPEQVPGISERMRQGVMLRGEQGEQRRAGHCPGRPKAQGRRACALPGPACRPQALREPAPQHCPGWVGEGKAGGGAAGPEG